MKKITAEMIMDKEPCEDWTEERVRKYIGKGKTLKEILEIKEVSEEDRISVSYTHLRVHETPEHLVCRLLLEKKNKSKKQQRQYSIK